MASVQPTTTTTTEPQTYRQGIVYEIANWVNDMKYVGSTIHPLQSRFQAHKTMSSDVSNTSKFYTAMRAIGVEQFSIRCLEVVKYVDEKDLRKREFEFIGKYNKENLYNMDLELGARSAETREKIAEALTGRTLSEESKLKISVANQKGGRVRIRENVHRIEYQYCKDGKSMSKSFSYGSRSYITKDQALILAKAYQRETFPELFGEED